MVRSSSRQPGQLAITLGERRTRHRDADSSRGIDPRCESAGQAGERLAAEYLQSKGSVIVARNWRAPQTRNEIDLIVEDGDCLVFVEVKTARTTHFGDPVTWITPRKQAAIARAAAAYRVAMKPRQREFRFDAITIGPPTRVGKRALMHVIGAFALGEGWTV